MLINSFLKDKISYSSYNKKHLISIEDFSLGQIGKLFMMTEDNLNKPKKKNLKLKNKIVLNFFLESSTRTRISFEIAAKKIGCEVINVLDSSKLSLQKNESLLDTICTINSMKPNFLVVRSAESQLVKFLSNYVDCSIINAGDGRNEHPTQALTDVFLINRYKKIIKNLKIAICGDVINSRVARSNISLLNKLGAKINIFIPPFFRYLNYDSWLKSNWNVNIFNSIEDAITDAEVVMMLRIQKERIAGNSIISYKDYHKFFGLNHKNIKCTQKNVVVLHPGPINRGIEISSDLADDKSFSLIGEQVKTSVAMKESILEFML